MKRLRLILFLVVLSTNAHAISTWGLPVQPAQTGTGLMGIGRIDTPVPGYTAPYSCSGTAVAPDIILTAAHCFDLAGNGQTDSRATTFHTPWGGVYSGVSYTIPSYVRVNDPVYGYDATNDFAAIKLSTPLASNVTLYPIAMDPLFRFIYSGDLSLPSPQIEEVREGRIGSILRDATLQLGGFGRYYVDGNYVSFGDYHFGTNVVTELYWGRGGLVEISLSGSDVQRAAIAASGDSGSALFLPTSQSDAGMAIVGVDSFGTGGTNASYPGAHSVYTYPGQTVVSWLMSLLSPGEQLETIWIDPFVLNDPNDPLAHESDFGYIPPPEILAPIEFPPNQSIPEPATLWLFVFSIVLMGETIRRRRVVGTIAFRF